MMFRPSQAGWLTGWETSTGGASRPALEAAFGGLSVQEPRHCKGILSRFERAGRLFLGPHRGSPVWIPGMDGSWVGSTERSVIAYSIR